MYARCCQGMQRGLQKLADGRLAGVAGSPWDQWRSALSGHACCGHGDAAGDGSIEAGSPQETWYEGSGGGAPGWCDELLNERHLLGTRTKWG